MRRFFIILGLLASILAVVLSVTPLSKIAYIPSIAALLFGLIAFYLSKEKQYPKKSIQLIFLLTIISLTITTYKAVFTVVEVGNVEDLELKEKESEENAIDVLKDLELDENEFQMEEIEDVEGLDSIR